MDFNTIFASINIMSNTITRTMKQKLSRLASFLVLILLTTMLHSCQEDEAIAYTLDGIWEGEVASDYFNYRWGTVTTEYQDVDMQFYVDEYARNSGVGVEYDYQSNGYYVRCTFSYEVRNGIIYLSYSDGSYVAIRNYHLTGSTFSGEFIDYNTGDYLASFNFYKADNYRYTRATRSGVEYKEVPSPRLAK